MPFLSSPWLSDDSDYDSWREGWTVTVGAGGVYQPAYPGSAAHAATPFPFVGLDWRDRLTIGGQAGQGAKADVLRAGPLKAELSARYDGGRDSSEADALDGLDDIPWGVGLGGQLEAEWFYGGLEVAISGERVLAGSASGWRGELSTRLGAPVPGTDRLILGIRPSIAAGDSAYRNARFGVAGDEAAASGYDPYEPGAGAISYSFPLVAVYLKENWLGVAFAGPERVSDAVADSPINRRRWQLQAVVGLGYRFSP